MGWYHFLAIYLFGCIGVFASMARTDAHLISQGVDRYYSRTAADKVSATLTVVIWPVVLAILGPQMFVGWAYEWLIRVFTPKPKPASPPPPPEPEHVPGNAYRDGGKACTCGARRG